MTGKNLILSLLSLLTSFGTLFCCALPVLFVSLGLGANFAGLIALFPQIVWLSENKPVVFGLSALLVFFGFLLSFLNRNAPCPIDPTQKEACQKARTWSVRILFLSILLWVIGVVFAFVIPVIS